LTDGRGTGAVTCLKKYTYAVIGSEISRIARYADLVIQIDPVPGDRGYLAGSIRSSREVMRASVSGLERIPELGWNTTAVLLFNGNFNQSTDIQGTLEAVRPVLSRSSRVVAVIYNPYFSWIYRMADRLGLRDSPACVTFVTRTDLHNLARLSGFELVRLRPVAHVPWHFFGVGTLLNMLLPAIPGLRWLSMVSVAVLRPIPAPSENRPSISIIVPARNEKGNIENAVARLPDLSTQVEVIFVEGHSNDGTWEEIERIVSKWDGRRGLRVRAFVQEGRGKADAVRLGFSKATGDLLTILDADLTMPPEMLRRFYEAYRRGLADFVNGTRLVYPMEGGAMRFLNRLGNAFFAKVVSHVLDTKLADTLCGTKLLARSDYERFTAWRRDFGDFDPFGDFELLFPAAVLGLGVVDVPVQYRSRTYGTTNIRRFRDGLKLLEMSITGFARIKMADAAGMAIRRPRTV
jgi:hypothetical protein